jgi:hypothetical protein
MSFTITVPGPVPSVFHSSTPKASRAAKYVVRPIRVKLDGSEEGGPG